jgi:N-methylhydantoinase B
MTNTLNTPVEAIEYEFPFRINQYAIRKNSGGNGYHTGGNGIIREILLLNDAECTMLSDRRIGVPYGISGGLPGKPGENILKKNGKEIKLPGKFNLFLNKGDILRIETPGGGGYGEKE